jgi:hypothetical protein
MHARNRPPDAACDATLGYRSRRTASRRIASNLLAVGLLAIAADESAAQWDRETQIRLAGSLVRIEAVTRSGRYSFGSGVLIAPQTLVTNCHVTRQAVQVSVVQRGLRHTAAAQAADVHHDLCVLQVPGLVGAPVRVEVSEPLRPGQPLLGVGFSGGVGLQFSQGELLSLHRLDGHQVLRSTNWFTSGASGGALFDEQGRLRGVLTFRLRGGPAHYFSVPATWIEAVAGDASRFAPIAPLEGGAFWEQEAATQVPFLRAIALEVAQQWQALARLATRWSEDDPQDAGAPLALSDALERLEQWDAAEAALGRALTLEPGLAEGWWRRGRLLVRLGRIAEARAALARLLPLDETLGRQLAALVAIR